MENKRELPRITCIIPAYNEEKRLGKCLESLKKQSYPQEILEIIVVDDDSRDRTVQIAESFGARVVRNGEHNIERGKSIGVQHASGAFTLLLDADNSLPETDWLLNAVTALLDNPEAVGAQAAWFNYSRDDYLANRYCALFGINDPFAFFLKKRDKLTWYEKEWVIEGTLLASREKYFLVKFDAKHLPTVGSQGFLISRELLFSTNYKPYLFHMDMNLELVKRGKDVFVIMRENITHDHCRTLGELLKKISRNFNLFLLQKEMRSYRWETSVPERVFALISMLTVVRPTVESIRGYLYLRDPAWFLHPVICFFVPMMVGYLYTKWLFAKLLRR